MNIFDYAIKINGASYMDPISHKIGFPVKDPTPDMYKKYTENHGYVAFVTENGEYYVSPYGALVVDELKKAGYVKDPKVPIPLGLPADPMMRANWEEHCMAANKMVKEKEAKERQSKLATIAEKKNLSLIPEEVKVLSLEFPEDGLEIINYVGEKVTLSPFSDAELENSMGKYYENNGVIMFADTTGKTYVSPFSDVVTKALNAAGYTQGHAPVHFSNGEKPTHPWYAARWIELCKQAKEAALMKRETASKEGQIR